VKRLAQIVVPALWLLACTPSGVVEREVRAERPDLVPEHSLLDSSTGPELGAADLSDATLELAESGVDVSEVLEIVLDHFEAVDSRPDLIDLMDTDQPSDASAEIVDLEEQGKCIDEQSCDDGDPCTSDICEPTVGCSNVPKCPNETVCLAGGVCCKPLLCGQWGAVCGVADDLCGGTIACGECSAGKECIDNVCTDGVCGFDEISSLTGYLWDVVKLSSGHLAALVDRWELRLEVSDLASDWMVSVKIDALWDEKSSLSARGNRIGILGRATGLEEKYSVQVFSFDGEQLNSEVKFDLLSNCKPEEDPNDNLTFGLLPEDRLLVRCVGVVQAYDYSDPGNVTLAKAWPTLPEWPAPEVPGLAIVGDRAYFFAPGEGVPWIRLWVVDAHTLEVVVEASNPFSYNLNDELWLHETEGRTIVAGDNSIWTRVLGAEEEWKEYSLAPEHSLDGMTSYDGTVVLSVKVDGGYGAREILFLDAQTLQSVKPAIEFPTRMRVRWADTEGIVLSLRGTAVYLIPQGATEWKEATLLASYPGKPEEMILINDVLWSLASDQRLVAYDMRNPASPVEVGEILGTSIFNLVVAGGTLFHIAYGPVVNVGWDVRNPANPVPLGGFGEADSHAGWEGTYITASVSASLEPGEADKVLFYQANSPADWELIASLPPPCEFTGNFGDLLGIAGNIVAVMCDDDDEIYLYHWDEIEKEFTSAGKIPAELQGVRQLAGLAPGVLLARGMTEFSVLDVSMLPYQTIWTGDFDSDKGQLSERSHRFVGGKLWLPLGTNDSTTGVFDLSQPSSSPPVMLLPKHGETVDVRKGVAFQGHGDRDGIRIYDVSGCWGE
jgi:hypothetical protein